MILLLEHNLTKRRHLIAWSFRVFTNDTNKTGLLFGPNKDCWRTYPTSGVAGVEIVSVIRDREFVAPIGSRFDLFNLLDVIER